MYDCTIIRDIAHKNELKKDFGQKYVYTYEYIFFIRLPFILKFIAFADQTW